MYKELNVIEHTWTPDYWAERWHLVSPLGLIVAAGASWEALGLSEGLLGGSWSDLGASWEGLGLPFPSPRPRSNVGEICATLNDPWGLKAA